MLFQSFDAALLLFPLAVVHNGLSHVSAAHSLRRTKTRKLAGHTYQKEVVLKVTNQAYQQPFSGFFVMAHSDQAEPLFECGGQASDALAILAENGDPSPLVEYYSGAKGVGYVGVHSDGAPYFGGDNTYIVVPDDELYPYVTIAAMAINTNDCFVALNGQLILPGSVTQSPGYDAGTEENNESCESVPGPACAANTDNVRSGNGEGFVHVHRGIFGIGGFSASGYDWRNPMMSVAVREYDEDTTEEMATSAGTTMANSGDAIPVPLNSADEVFVQESSGDVSFLHGGSGDVASSEDFSGDISFIQEDSGDVASVEDFSGDVSFMQEGSGDFASGYFVSMEESSGDVSFMEEGSADDGGTVLVVIGETETSQPTGPPASDTVLVIVPERETAEPTVPPASETTAPTIPPAPEPSEPTASSATEAAETAEPTAPPALETSEPTALPATEVAETAEPTAPLAPETSEPTALPATEAAETVEPTVVSPETEAPTVAPTTQTQQDEVVEDTTMPTIQETLLSTVGPPSLAEPESEATGIPASITFAPTIVPSAEDSAPPATNYEDFFWAELPDEARAAAETLGYDQITWDNDLPIPADDLFWEDLTDVQQEAATLLGYDEVSWDSDMMRAIEYGK